MTTGNMVHCQLWMGGLEPYMTESFILASFQRMGEKPLNVKVMRNKFTGEPAGYCFVHFENDDEAIDAMHKLNGKVIPNTNPAVRFRLNTATNQGKIMMNEREFSLWVGDLTPEVDDYTLYKTFAGRYQSIKAAKVILDASGYSKGFGFLRFGSEDEQKHCLQHMNGYKGLGSKPLKISNAIPKTQRTTPTNGTPPAATTTVTNQYNSQDYSHYYDASSYWQNYSNWSGYYDGSGGGGGYSYDPSQYQQQYQAQQYPSSYPQQYYQQPPPATQPPPTVHPTAVPPPSAVQQVPILPGPPPQHQVIQGAHDEANEIVEHTPPMNVDRENEEYGESLLNFYMEVSDSSWIDWDIFEIEMSKLKPQSVPEDN